MSAVPLLPQVWAVGGSNCGTHSVDSHCYLVAGEAGAVLIDAGTGLRHASLIENILEIVSLEALHGVVLTHYHADHAGGAASLAASGVPIFGSKDAIIALQGFDEQKTQLAAARQAGLYPESYRPDPVPPAASSMLTDGDSLSLGDIHLVAHSTPGHCDGHLTYSLDVDGLRVLFSGDLLFAGGRVHLLPTPDCRPYEYARSVRRMHQLAPDALLPGHDGWVLKDATSDIALAVDDFDRLRIPPLLAGSERGASNDEPG